MRSQYTLATVIYWNSGKKYLQTVASFQHLMMNNLVKIFSHKSFIVFLIPVNLPVKAEVVKKLKLGFLRRKQKLKGHKLKGPDM